MFFYDLNTEEVPGLSSSYKEQGTGRKKGDICRLDPAMSGLRREGETFWKVQKVFLRVKGGGYVKKADGP